MLPSYRAEIISLIKATAIVGYIAVQDLTRVSDIIRGRTYDAFFPLIASAAFYIIMAEILILIVRKIEIVSDPKSRDESKILRGAKIRQQ